MNTNMAELGMNNKRMDQFTAQRELARRKLKNLEAMVFRKDEVPVVLKDISSIANDCGIRIDQLTPQALSAKPVVENSSGKYYTMDILIRIRTGYHRLGKFLNQMELRHLFWQIDELAINVDPKDPLREEVKMKLRILVLEK
jgi:Tfp pilus assembly protein PilO